jgi:hypothetical protein
MRASKKKRNTDSSAFHESVEASQAHDDELAGTGVEHDAAGPVHLVKLTEDQHREVGDKLAATLLEIEQRKAEKKKVTKEFKDDITLLELKRDTLRDEWTSGQRKEDAQPPLPGLSS